MAEIAVMVGQWQKFIITLVKLEGGHTNSPELLLLDMHT